MSPGAEEAGVETVTFQLVSSDIHSKFRQLTAYLQLSAEEPFSDCGSTLQTYARQAKTPGFSPQTMMDGEWVDKRPVLCLSVGTILSPRVTLQEGGQ